MRVKKQESDATRKCSLRKRRICRTLLLEKRLKKLSNNLASNELIEHQIGIKISRR